MTKEKHPTWFKMKLERRQLIKEIPAETAVNVLLACWDYLETMEIPKNLSAIEKIAFFAFFPDMEEAWARYEQRVRNGASGGRKPAKTIRFHTVPNGVEEETETEEEVEEEKEGGGIKKPATPPALEPVCSFFDEHGAGKASAEKFFRHFSACGWMDTRNRPIVNWKARAAQWIAEDAEKAGPVEERPRLELGEDGKCRRVQ